MRTTTIIGFTIAAVAVGTLGTLQTGVGAQTQPDLIPAQESADGCFGTESTVPLATDLETVAGSRLIDGPVGPSAGGRAMLEVVVDPASPPAASFQRLEAGSELQIIGQVEATNEFRVVYEHDVSCADLGEDSRVVVDVYDDGSASVTVTDGASVAATIGVEVPWAIDSEGRELATWYEADGSKLVQVVDARGASGTVTFDPTYTWLSCTVFSGDRLAMEYLDVNGTTTVGVCPISGMFTARNNYWPVYGSQTSILNDYGKVIVRQDGFCNVGSTTGLTFDYTVPCKAHDYCYDLRGAGFSGTVTDLDCDRWFFWLMEADCNDRSWLAALDCRIIRDAYYYAVRLPFVVTSANPGIVEVRNYNSGLCLDVQGTPANAQPLQQNACNGQSNRRYKIWPAPGAPGYFQLKPLAPSSMCARDAAKPQIWTCYSTWNSERYELDPLGSADRVQIRNKYYVTDCWRAKNTAVKTNLSAPTCNAADPKQWWRIIDV